jgi:hypothetical protein
MADNRQLPATGTGTADIVVATDDIGGVNYQRIKLALGADGTAADAPVGGGTEAGVLRVTIASDSTGVLSVDDNGAALTVDGTVAISTNSELGIVTESAPGTDTASSGLNGRLQRIAQRLTSLIALFPTALINSAFAVISVGSGTNAASQVTISNTSTTIIASRAGRRGVLILNKQTVAVSIDVSGGTAVYATHFVLDPGAAVFLPVTNAVTGITSAAYSASGDAKLHLIEVY